MINIPHFVTLLQNQKQPVPTLTFPSNSTYTNESEYSDVYAYYIKTMRQRILNQEEYSFILDFHKYWIKPSSQKLREYANVTCSYCKSEVYTYKVNYDPNKVFWCSRKCMNRGWVNNVKYTLIPTYFENDLTDEIVYHLGYIFSMGSIVGNTEPAVYLYHSDKSKLEYVQGFLGSDSPITGYRDNSVAVSPDNCYKMVLNSGVLVDSVYKYGLNVMDMFSQSIPEISSDLYGAFIRGFLDGCDTLPIKDDNMPTNLINKSYMIFSRDMFRWIRDWLVEAANIGFVCDYFGIGDISVNITNISVIEEYYDRRFYMRVLIN